MANNLSCNKFHNNVWFQKISKPALRRVTENSKVKGGLTWNTIWYKAAVQIKKIYHWIGMDIFLGQQKKGLKNLTVYKCTRQLIHTRFFWGNFW